MEQNYKYEISVIMVSYNPSLIKLIKTINSVICQKDICLQFIICDDGSAHNYFSEIEKYLSEKRFNDYKLVGSDINNGTVINFYRGLLVAEGKYIKAISPGDYLYNDNTLCNWLKFMNKHNIDMSFGHAVFYHFVDEKPVLVKRHRDAPAIARIYDLNRRSELNKEIRKIDWLVCRDSILGCLIICKSELCKEYILEIVNRIKFAEDYMFRLMLLDNIEMVHYDAPVLYYEYGNGVSSSPEKWKKYLYNDEVSFMNILRTRKNQNRFIKQYNRLLRLSGINFYSKRRQFFSVMIFPLSLPWKIGKLIYRKIGKSKQYRGNDSIIKEIEEL